MTDNIVPRTSSALPWQIPSGFSRSEAKTLVRLQNAELINGLVAATRVKAAATVAGVGMHCVGMLSREARFQENGDPAAADRLQHLADQLTVCVGGEVARFGP